MRRPPRHIDVSLPRPGPRLAGAIAAGVGLIGLALRAPAQPTADDTIEAFARVEAWTRAWRAPEVGSSPDPVGTQGACVTLRLDGETLGRGAWMASAPASESSAGDSLARAFTLAWREAEARAPAPRDALHSDAMRALAQRMSVDVQIAGPLIPLVADDWSDAARSLSPGLDGVAGRVGGRVEAVFPGTMLATNLPTQGALRAVTGALDLPPVDLATLRDRRGVRLYRFRVRHAAQLAPGSPPIFLHRGERVQPIESAAPAALPEIAQALAANLRARLDAEGAGLHGAYRPWVGDYEPPDESAVAVQALAALALAQQASLEVGDARASNLRSAVGAIARLFPLPGPASDRLTPPPESALLALLALDAIRRADAHTPIEHVNVDAIVAALARESTAPAHEGASRQTPLPIAALRACALSAWAQPALRAFVSAGHGAADDAKAIAARADAALREALRRGVADGDLTPAMPWLGWAILLQSQGEAQVASAAALREHRDLVFRHQLTRFDAPFEDRDLEGGVVFTRGGAALPTWRTAQALVFPAMMLGDARLTETSELPRAVINLSRSLRFVRQLQADEAVMHMFPDRAEARGGLRAALWDQRMPIEATAMALLAVVETIRSLRGRVDEAVHAGG